MDETFFYLLGGALVLAALGAATVGVRWADGFPSPQVMRVGIAVFALLVGVTATFAVLGARAEQEHREAEQAAEEAGAAAETGATEQAGATGEKAAGGGQAQPQPAAASETLEVTSPEDGSLSFEPAELEAKAGTIALAYDNPSPVTHNIFLQDDEDTVLAESDDVSKGSVEISAELTPGEYFYYCNIPGHREGGMEGVLTVQ